MGVGGRGVEVTVWLNSMFDSRHNPKIKFASRPLPLKHNTNFHNIIVVRDCVEDVLRSLVTPDASLLSKIHQNF